MSYVSTILIIGLLISVHELGHLLAAHCMGIPVARFSIGFGPVLWARRIRDVEYCISLVPLGGYVLPRFEDESEFRRIPAARQIVLWLGGPLANLLAAGFLLATVNGITDGLSWYGQLVQPWIQVGGQSAEFVAALSSIIARPDQLSGIIGIVATGKSVMGGGVVSALRFAVLLNLNLAIFNLLPIAPLDGGKIFCSLLEKLDPRLARLRTGFSLAGLALLLSLMVYTTVLDVVRQLA
jgi:regulator of sigma E protease